MTLVVTISTRDGIVIGGDRQISFFLNGRYYSRNVGRRKVIPLPNQSICVAYWGLATINHIPTEKHIKTVKRTVLQSGNFNINTFSQELYNYLSGLNINHPTL